MIKEGPVKGSYIPVGSILVCWKCDRPLFLADNKLFSGKPIEEDRLIDIRSKRLYTQFDPSEFTCRFCGAHIYHANGFVRFIPPRDTLGSRISIFIIQGVGA